MMVLPTETIECFVIHTAHKARSYHGLQGPIFCPQSPNLFQLPWIACSFKASSRIFPLVYTHARTLTHIHIHAHHIHIHGSSLILLRSLQTHYSTIKAFFTTCPNHTHCLWTVFLVFCFFVFLGELEHQQLLLLPCAGFSRDKSLAEPEAPLSGCQGPGALCFYLTVLEWAP